MLIATVVAERRLGMIGGLQMAYDDIKANWVGQLDWVNDNEFTFALACSDSDELDNITEWMEDLAKRNGVCVDSTHDGHFVFWKEVV